MAAPGAAAGTARRPGRASPTASASTPTPRAPRRRHRRHGRLEQRQRPGAHGHRRGRQLRLGPAARRNDVLLRFDHAGRRAVLLHPAPRDARGRRGAGHPARRARPARGAGAPVPAARPPRPGRGHGADDHRRRRLGAGARRPGDRRGRRQLRDDRRAAHDATYQAVRATPPARPSSSWSSTIGRRPRAPRQAPHRARRGDVTPATPGSTVVLQLRLRDRFGWWPVQRHRLDRRSHTSFRAAPAPRGADPRAAHAARRRDGAGSSGTLAARR